MDGSVRLSALTDRNAVLQAIREHDAIGREAFLAKYGFAQARTYVLRWEGRDYDSKAIAGAALGYQAGVNRALRPDEFSGGANTVAARLRGLGFEVRGTDRARPARDLHAASIEFAIGRWDRVGRDAFLAELGARPANRYLLVRAARRYDAKALVQAAWQFEHPDEEPLRAGDFRGDRHTIAEPLRALGFTVIDTDAAAPRTTDRRPRRSTATVEDVPIEARNVERVVLQGDAAVREIVRREAALVEGFAGYLTSIGHTVVRQRIDLPDESAPLYTDLWDATTRELVEAKASNGREEVRMALGQLLDYSRYIDAAQLSVLLPVAPKPDHVNLLTRHAVGVIYPEDHGWRRLNPSAQPTD